MTITQYAIIMVFGALVAGAGLLLLVLRKEQAENKIKLFGQEFQISTPALVVFLVGCGVFIIPVLIPARDQSAITIALPWQNASSGGARATPVTLGEEREPNDQITAPNLITMGSTIKGLVATDQDRDFFRVKTSAQGLKTRIILRKTLPGFCANVAVYDAVEKEVDSGMECGENAVSFAFNSNPNSEYYIEVEGYSSGSRGPYELLVKEE